MNDEQSIAKARVAFAAIGGEGIRRQIFLCALSEKQSCCSRETGEAAWKYLKRRLKELGLTKSAGVQRTKADCLQVCIGGPIAVVWPEGVSSSDPKGLDPANLYDPSGASGDAAVVFLPHIGDRFVVTGAAG